MKLSFKPDKKNSGLSAETAQQMLSNVFAACGREPNSVPLEALSSYSNYRKERYAIQRTVIVLVLLLFLLLPILFFSAKVQVKQTNPGQDANPDYAVSISALVPIREIEAQLAGRSVPLYEVAGGEYRIHPRDNGEMIVSVTLANRQKTVVSVNVDSVDADGPKLLYTETEEDFVLFYVNDEGSGVNYAGITITDPDGKVSEPAGYDAQEGCIRLAYPEVPLLVHIPDMRGNGLQVQLKPDR